MAKILRIKAEILNDKVIVSQNQDSIRASISGSFVVGGDFPGQPRLRLRGQKYDEELEFSEKRSSRIAKKFPDAKNAENARIKTIEIEYYYLPVHLFLETEDGSRSEFVRTLDLPLLEAARDLSLLKLYKHHTTTNRSKDIFTHLEKIILSRKSSLTNNMARAWLYGAFERRPNRFANYMSRVKQRMNELERFKAFDAFEEELLKEGVKVQSPHGGFEFLAKQNADNLWEAYNALAGELKNIGLNIFLNSGTLLGAIRDGNFLPHDDDIDVAVILGADNEVDAGIEFTAVKALLQRHKLLDEHSGEHSAGLLKLRRINGVQVDLFPAWISQDDRVYIYPHTYGTLPKSDLLDLKIWNRMRNTYIPNRPEQILASNYGDNWKIPDPYFRFQWRKKHQFRKFLEQLQDPPK